MPWHSKTVNGLEKIHQIRLQFPVQATFHDDGGRSRMRTFSQETKWYRPGTLTPFIRIFPAESRRDRLEQYFATGKLRWVVAIIGPEWRTVPDVCVAGSQIPISRFGSSQAKGENSQLFEFGSRAPVASVRDSDFRSPAHSALLPESSWLYRTQYNTLLSDMFAIFFL